MRNDLRREQRQDCSPTVRITWCDPFGNDKFANAVALDISGLGARLKVPEALPVRACVGLSSERLRIHGQASVRHCFRSGGNYVIGVEFARGYRWNPERD